MSSPVVWVPYADLADRVGDLPPSLRIDVYDGTGQPPASIDDVEFYVVPYMGPPHVVELIHDLPALRVVQTLTAGVDNVRPHMREGLTLCNARGVHDASTAELAVALILAALRGIDDFARAQPEGRWLFSHRDALADKTVLIVGYGGIGAALERRLDGFECDVLRVARRPRDGVSGLDDLPSLLPRADVVVLTVPMTADTERLVDARFLGAMKDGALLVNVSRGRVVDTEALVAEVTSGRLRAALDVTDPEPLPPDHPLWRVPGVLITPHVGGATSAFLPRAYQLIGAQLRRYAAGEPLVNVVTGAY
jgi:phosphoglycerate dehydrogenase-like enzyme